MGVGLTKFYLFKTIPWKREGGIRPLWIRACFDDDDDDDYDDNVMTMMLMKM